MDIEDFFSNAVETSGQFFSPLALAYIGDAVFELCIRAYVMQGGNAPSNNLSKKTHRYVSAAAQAKMYMKIYDIVTDEERAILRRGRNAKSNSKAKSSSVLEYRHATGLESLFGYLFLNGKNKRIMEIFKICMDDGN